MVRTQIYLTEEEKAQLETIALTRGVKQSELIREAVDELIEKYTPSQRLTRIKQARGLWKNRRDLPALGDLRLGWSRRAQT
jgi:metal-responsive CopG/Arc/MetJ family transcriptional regulator